MHRQGYTEAKKEAKTIYDQLNEQKNLFLSGKSPKTRQDDADVFIENCLVMLENAPKINLQQHRGFKLISNLFFNALEAIVAFLRWGPFQAIEPSPTASMHKVHVLQHSLTMIFKKPVKGEHKKCSDPDDETSDPQNTI